MNLKLCYFVFLMLGLSISASSQAQDQASKIEAAIVTAVDARNDGALELLDKAVNINSGTMNFEGVKAVADLFAAPLQALGFSTAWVDGSGFGRAGHLVASRGTAGPKILLIGHLDTVFASDSPFQSFEHIDADHAGGPGVTDMKGGDVVMITALQALRDAGVLDDVQLRVVMTGDEEKRGRPLALANSQLIEAARWADYALGFEDGDSNPETAVISRRGASGWKLQVEGQPAHSSQVFRDDIGYGAIFELSRILEQFRLRLAGEPNLTFNPGLVVGGTELTVDLEEARASAYGKNNVIASLAVVSGDIRALTPKQLASAQGTMREVVSGNLNGTKASLEFFEGYPPMPPTKGNRELLQRYSQISEELGFGPVRAVEPRRAGAADISFAAEHLRGGLDGLGLMGRGGHTIDEVADLRTLPQQAKRAAILIFRLSRDQNLN